VSVPRKDNLSRDELVDATLALIDDVGIDAVTMRLLASKLGTSPMAPYSHVPNKQALLELAADVIYERVIAPETSLDPWERVRALFEAILDVSDLYPWTVDVLMSMELTQGADTPNVQRVRAMMHGLLRDLGFSAAVAALAAETNAEVITGLLIQKRLRTQRKAAAGRTVDAETAVDALPEESAIRAFTTEVFLSGLRVQLSDPANSA
jgi:AcrR family transcriptional regulator